MQPMKVLNDWLHRHANGEHYLFSSRDLRVICPDLSEAAFKALLSRAVKQGILERVCRGLYIYQCALRPDGLLLFHAAAYLRSDAFNYISLETVLSDSGVIAQIPLNWVSLMSSGRSNVISCGRWGTLEFVHTDQKPQDLAEKLIYDERCGLWRASVALALRDIKATRRSRDLIDWEEADELTR